MFGCAACGRLGAGPLCRECRGSLVAGPPAIASGDLLVAAPFRHEGAARRLVHVLKYSGSSEAALILGQAMAAVVPPSVTALVPVRRARIRRWQYGSDPAELLSQVVSRITGLPVADVLSPGWWWPRHAGQERHRRARPRWRAHHRGLDSWMLVDDVLTTGATLQTAAQCLGGDASLCLVATAAGRVTREGGTAPVPSNWERAWHITGGPIRVPGRRASS